MIKVTPDMETLVLLKYGTKSNAKLMWWGRAANNENEWERQVIRKWQKEEEEATYEKWLQQGRGDVRDSYK